MSSWYYGQGGQQEGPLDEATMRERIAGGLVKPEDLVWREGMAKWLPLKEVGELSTMGGDLSTSPYAPPATDPVQGQPMTYAPVPPTSGLAIAALVCGILSLIFCYINAVVGIPAVICGHMAMKRIREANDQIGGKGMALAGLICGYIGIVFQLITIAFFGFIIAGSMKSGRTMEQVMEDAVNDIEASEQGEPQKTTD